MRVSGTACLLGGQCVGVCPTGALKPKREWPMERGMTPDKIVPTTCPYCGVGRNLELHIKDEYIYKVTSPFDSVVNHGNLCVKGRFGYDFIYNKDRVTTPLIRRTPQTSGHRTQAFDRAEWREVSWDEALDYTADRIKRGAHGDARLP